MKRSLREVPSSGLAARKSLRAFFTGKMRGFPEVEGAGGGVDAAGEEGGEEGAGGGVDAAGGGVDAVGGAEDDVGDLGVVEEEAGARRRRGG